MDNAYPPEAWKRLGEKLRERRGELGYGFRQRKQFLEDRGGPPPSAKMLDRIENGSRTYYPDATIATLERIYAYQRGSFEAILKGDEPVPLAGGPRLSPVPDPSPPLDLSTADDAVISAFIGAWPEEPPREKQRKEIMQATWNAYLATRTARDLAVDALTAVLWRGTPRLHLRAREEDRESS